MYDRQKKKGAYKWWHLAGHGAGQDVTIANNNEHVKLGHSEVEALHPVGLVRGPNSAISVGSVLFYVVVAG